MAVRITTVRKARIAALRVEGKLLAADIDVLFQAVSEAGESVLLDFTDLQATDDAGLEAILQLVDQGSRVVAASPYLKLCLERSGAAGAASAPSAQGEVPEAGSQKESKENRP